MNEPHITPSQETSRMLRRIKNREAVRWYVMQLPVASGSPQAAASELQAEQERRQRQGEPPFEYFAPTFVVHSSVRGKQVVRHCPLLYNYVFLRASENEIFRLKRILPAYNFLPRVFTDDDYHYPYISDREMENLRWVASSYANVLPVLDATALPLVRGDKIRIIEGELKGTEAEVVRRPGSRHREVVVCLLQNVVIPLGTLKPGQYEVISLSQDGKQQYAHLGNEQQFLALHQMLGRLYTQRRLSAEEFTQARQVVSSCSALQLDSDVLRSKALVLLLLAYKVLDLPDDFTRTLGTILRLLPLVKAEQSRALLFTFLYGCTDSSIYHEQCHSIIDPWAHEAAPKKSKRFLLQCVTDYDRWYGHPPHFSWPRE